MTKAGDKASGTKMNRGLSDQSPCKSLRIESTEDSLNVDGDLGYTIQ